MVNIFIPVYNGQKYLAQTLESVLNQTYQDWELLCVDDSSNDESLNILHSYAQRDGRIKVFHKANEGCVPPSWLFVMPHLTGAFTLYMSQDDVIETDLLESLVLRQKETGADAVMPTEYAYFEDKPREEWPLYGIPELMDKVISGKKAFKLMIDYQIPGFALWRTDIIKQGGMRTDTFNCDELAQRHWASLCNKVAFSHGVFLWRCDNPQAITKADSPRRYEVAYTHALLLQLAERVLADDKAFLEELGNLYFFKLFKSMVLFKHKHKNYQLQDAIRVNYCHKKAYDILRTRNTLKNWKYHIGGINYCFMKVVVEFKYRQQKKRGVIDLY
jgi:glycosyltransferase involved in cell wall biosynthesis